MPARPEQVLLRTPVVARTWSTRHPCSCSRFPCQHQASKRRILVPETLNLVAASCSWHETAEFERVMCESLFHHGRLSSMASKPVVGLFPQSTVMATVVGKSCSNCTAVATALELMGLQTMPRFFRQTPRGQEASRVGAETGRNSATYTANCCFGCRSAPMLSCFLSNSNRPMALALWSSTGPQAERARSNNPEQFAVSTVLHPEKAAKPLLQNGRSYLGRQPLTRIFSL
mmetsp:Transcript_36172/g.69689  ORF Transcript_36172/g.69689 Transcript_36172/m.69689 type:complete len:230 (-) Transcript_36172:6-695(-)